MWLYSSLVGPRRRAVDTPGCCRRSTAVHKLSVERLEDRSLPSVVGPLPIPGGKLIPNPFGGPDVHQEAVGPADSTQPGTGGEPINITDFNGFIGQAQVEGTGTDGNGNTLLWRADLRFMKGDYQGTDGKLYHGAFAEV